KAGEDEAGASQDEVQEPIITVSSVIVHGDLQTGPIEQDAEQIISTLVPQRLRQSFEFHGKELFSGSHRLRGWQREDRYAALRAFMELIPKHNLRVHAMSIVKEGYWRAVALLKPQGFDRDSQPHILHEDAFHSCATLVEAWFRRNANFERGFCIADETKARDKIKGSFSYFRKRPPFGLKGEVGLQLNQLIDMIYFGDSRESVFLQLVDCSAFFIKRTVMERADAQPFYSIIERQVAPQPL